MLNPNQLKAMLAEKTEFKVQTIQLEKGLSRDDALKAATPKMKGDHRGFNYVPETGIAKFI